MYNTDSQIKVKTTVLRSSLWDYSLGYIIVKGTIIFTVTGADVAARQAGERNTRVIPKNCAPFTDCISKINIIQVDNVKDLDAGIPMYSLIKYCDNYSKKSGMSILQR